MSGQTHPSQAACDRSKLDRNTFVAALVAHCLAALIRKTLVPCGSNIDASGKDRNKAAQPLSACCFESASHWPLETHSVYRTPTGES